MFRKFLIQIYLIAVRRAAFRYVYICGHELQVWDYTPLGIQNLGTFSLKNDLRTHSTLWSEEIATAIEQLPNAKAKRVQCVLDSQLTLNQRIEISAKGSWKQAVGIALARDKENSMRTQLWGAWRSPQGRNIAWVVHAHQHLITELVDICESAGLEIYSIQSACWLWLRTLLDSSSNHTKPCVLLVHASTAVQCMFWDGSTITQIISLHESDFEAAITHHELERLRAAWVDFLRTAQTHTKNPLVYYTGEPKARKRMEQCWQRTIDAHSCLQEAPNVLSEVAFQACASQPHVELLPSTALKKRRLKSWMQPVILGFASITAMGVCASLYWEYEARKTTQASHKLEAHIAPWMTADTQLCNARYAWERQHATLDKITQSEAWRIWLIQFFATIQEAMRGTPDAWVERLEIEPIQSKAGQWACSIQIAWIRNSENDEPNVLKIIQHQLNTLHGLEGRVRARVATRTPALKNYGYLNFKLRLPSPERLHAEN